jgi:crotonobetainyl-CoA:carnitine CoA-transferase CaiB-like acyl-CoA transferase
MVVEVDHPVIGRMKTLGVPVKLSETPGSVTRAAPMQGQHTREILLELGYSESEIEAMAAQNVVCVK